MRVASGIRHQYAGFDGPLAAAAVGGGGVCAVSRCIETLALDEYGAPCSCQ